MSSGAGKDNPDWGTSTASLLSVYRDILRFFGWTSLSIYSLANKDKRTARIKSFFSLCFLSDATYY